MGKNLQNRKYFLSSPQADGVLRNTSPAGTDFIKTRSPLNKLRGFLKD
jgi:hypothetical protein